MSAATMTPGGHGRPWTPAEDLVIRHHYPAGLPLPDLAAALGRGGAAVRARANRLGARRPGRAPMTPAARAKRPWTSDDDDLIRERWGHWSEAALARALGRSRLAVRVRKKRLGISHHTTFTNANSAARLFGVDRHLVARWIEEGLLAAKRSPLRASDAGRMWIVDPDGLESFVLNRREQYDWRRMEEGWHRDLAERAHRADPLLTPAEVAALHGVNRETINRDILGGRLPATKGRPQNRGGAPYSWWVLRSEAMRWRPRRPELCGNQARRRARKAVAA